MQVFLLAHTPQPERVVAAAARNCYSAADTQDLYDNLTEEKVADFLHMLTEIGHASPIEHASFTFGIEGVSRSLLAQITRHRIASFSVKSQRYVRESQFSYVTPPAIAACPQARETFQRAMAADQRAYEELTELLCQQHVAELTGRGVEEKEARRRAEKMAMEDARFVLPNACETKIVMTMNARSLYNFFAVRGCRRAQWEIRQLAEEMYRLCLQAAPTLFAKAGPACVDGACPEGKMSCGQAQQVRDTYRRLRQQAGAEK